MVRGADLEEVGLDAAEREAYQATFERARSWNPNLGLLLDNAYLVGMRRHAGENRKTAPQVPYWRHIVESDRIFLRASEEVASEDDQVAHSIIRAGIFLHDTIERRIQVREEEVARSAASQDGESFDSLPPERQDAYLPSQEQRSNWRNGGIHGLYRDLQALARDVIRQKGENGLNQQFSYSLIDDVIVVVDKLTRERRHREYIETADGFKATYPLHVQSLVDTSTQTQGLSTKPHHVAYVLIAKTSERSQGMDDLLPREHPSLDDAVNEAARSVSPKAFRLRREMLDALWDDDQEVYWSTVASWQEEHVQHRALFEEAGIRLFSGGGRLLNYMKNALVVNVAANWMRNKARNGSLARDLSPYLIGTLRRSILNLSETTERASIDEQNHLIPYHGITPGDARTFHEQVGEYFQLPESRERSVQPSEEIPEFLRVYDQFLNRYIGMMKGSGGRKSLDEDYQQQFMDAVVFEHLFRRFSENRDKPIRDWEVISGELF